MNTSESVLGLVIVAVGCSFVMKFTGQTCIQFCAVVRTPVARIVLLASTRLTIPACHSNMVQAHGVLRLSTVTPIVRGKVTVSPSDTVSMLRFCPAHVVVSVMADEPSDEKVKLSLLARNTAMLPTSTPIKKVIIVFIVSGLKSDTLDCRVFYYTSKLFFYHDHYLISEHPWCTERWIVSCI